jgi:predicted MFS family arabinose efflux permease
MRLSFSSLGGGDREARDATLFLVANILMGLGACVNQAVFNNYLKDVFALDVAGRTFLEFPREIPGFLVTLFVGGLALMGEVRIALVANLAASAGMLALGWIPNSYLLMVTSIFIYSSGAHIYMPLGSAIGMSFAKDGKEGGVLGRISAVNTAALVVGTLALLLLFEFASLSYRAAFSAGSLAYLFAALALWAMSPRKAAHAPQRFVVRKEYGRYYLLSVLWGGRKQLFITFGPWMIVDLFRQPVETMTLLFLIVSILGIVAQPFVGRMTDRFGIRAVLGAESLLMIAVCVTYAFAPELLPPGAALVVVSTCFILDQGSTAVGMARSIFAKRIVKRPEDLSPTLSLGISIDHVVSMSIPTLGGLVWRGAGNHGYRWVFLGGAVIAFLNFVVTRGIAKGDSPEALPARAGS